MTLAVAVAAHFGRDSILVFATFAFDVLIAAVAGQSAVGLVHLVRRRR